MSNPDTDLIFPPRAIPGLADERGPIWKNLVAHTQRSVGDSPDRVAFILLMARLDNCATCNADSYRAIQGCAACARQALKRYHGTDQDLLRLFEAARAEIKHYLSGKNQTHKPQVS